MISIDPFSPIKAILQFFWRLKKRGLSSRAQRQLTAADEAFKCDSLYAYLDCKYGAEPLLRRDGILYPVAVFRAPRSQQDDLRSILQPLSKFKPNDDYLLGDPHYRKILSQVSRNLDNRLTYTMKELVTGERLFFNCELGSYFNSIDTTEALEWELKRGILKRGCNCIRNLRKFEQSLPMRSRLEKMKIYDPIRSGKYRSVAMSISTLIAYYNDDYLELLVKRRSKSVATHSGFSHILPSHIFQPSTLDADGEYGIMHCICKEYLEELFDVQDESDSTKDYYYQQPAYVYLRSLLDSGKASLYLTGVAVNLLNMRPEICALLFIRTRDWFDIHSQSRENGMRFKFNFEYATKPRGDLSADQLGMCVRYQERDEDFLRMNPCLQRENMVPQGAGSFWLGVDLLRELL